MANEGVGDLPDPQGETDEFLRKLVEKIDTSALAQNIARVTEALTRPGVVAPPKSDLSFSDVDPATVPLGASESAFTPNDLFAGLDTLLNKYLGVRPTVPDAASTATPRESAAPWRGGWPLPTRTPSEVPLPPIPLPPTPPPAPPGGPPPVGGPKTPGESQKRDWTPADLLYGLDALFRKYFAPKPGGPVPPVPVGGPPGAPPPGTDMDALFKKYFGKKAPTPMGKREKDSSIGRGIGAWAKTKIRGAFRGGPAHRWKWAGKRIGAGAGRSLGLGAGGVSRLAGVAGGIGAAAGGLVGVIGVVGAVVGAFVKARDAVDDWTEQALATARKFAEFSGSMTVVMAERDIGQMMRDMKRGEATAGSARTLVGAEAGRKEEENRIGIVVDNATNEILAILNNIATEILSPIADALELADEAFRWILGKADKPKIEGGLASTLDDVAAAARRDDARGRDLMAIARDAAARAGGPGVAAPAGAAPRGRLP